MSDTPAPAPRSRALSRWLRARARSESARPTLEAALLAGALGPYARHRLRFVALGRGAATAIHLVEFLLLRRALADAALVTAVGLGSAAALAAGAWWGTLELLRVELRAREARDPVALRHLEGWLAAARRLALLVMVVTCAAVASLGQTATAAADAAASGGSRLVAAYVFAVGLRLALDLWVRTYYSGVYARQRVYRPMVAVLGIDLAGAVLAVGLWRWIGPLALPLSMVISTLLSRLLLVAYTRRSYLARGVQAPRARAHVDEGPRRHGLARVVAAACAGAALRVGPMLVLAGLAAARRADPSMVFVFHVLAPLLTTAGSWSQVFYLDFIRLRDPLTAYLHRRLARGLIRAGVAVGALCFLAGMLALALARISPAPGLVVTLALVSFALAQLSRISLEAFARGDFLPVALSGAAMTAVAFSLTWGTWPGIRASASVQALAGAGLAVVVGVAVLVWTGRRFQVPAPPAPVVETPAGWVARAMARETASTIGRLELADRRPSRTRAVADRVAALIGAPAAVVVAGDRCVLWQAAADRAPPDHALLVAGGGLVGSMDRITVPSREGLAALLESARGATLLGVDAGTASWVPTTLEAFRQSLASELPGSHLVDLRELGADSGLRGLEPAMLAARWRQVVAVAAGRRPRAAGLGSALAVLEGERLRLVAWLPPSTPPELVGEWRRRASALGWQLAVRQGDRAPTRGGQVSRQRWFFPGSPSPRYRSGP